MSATLTETLYTLDVKTRIQYGLLFLFGALCLLAAITPIELLIKAVIVSTLFGFTAGIWVFHLVQIIQEAADRKAAGTQ